MSASSGTSLRTKLLGLSVTTVVALALLFVVTLANDKQQMMTDRQEDPRARRGRACHHPFREAGT
ncbi:MAG: hypothetical protein U1E85_08695 [Rhodocyclaceae bacterium]